MAIEIFNRYEIKFLMSSFTFIQFERAIKDYMILDEHNKDGKFYTVANLYCDTDDYSLIRRSIEKPLYKEKLRLRTYGVPKLDNIVFCEVKKKYKGKVNKRRSRIELGDAYDFIENKQIKQRHPYMNNQVLNELEYMLYRYEDLKPKVYLAYDRRAYFGKDDKNLRISFDTNIRSRFSDLKLECGTHGAALLDKDVWLMEIKCYNMPIWLASILSELKLYPKSFSKYGNVYKKSIASKQIEWSDIEREVAATSDLIT